jgi:long-chain acyl-CoA synthetase
VLLLSEHGLIPPASRPRPHGGPTSIAVLLDDLVSDHPDEEALVGRSGRYTAVELDRAADRAANAFRSLGVGNGDRVAASLPNDVDLVVAFLGAMRLGAIWVGINRPLAAAEKAYMLADCQAGVFVGDVEMSAQIEAVRGDLPDLLDNLDTASWNQLYQAAPAEPVDVRVDPLAPAAIAYTSGTTGFPKGAVHSQHNLLLPGAVNAHRNLLPGAGVLGIALPLTILNLMILGPLVAFQTGSKLVTMDRVDGLGMAEWIETEGITSFSAVPAMVHDLLTHSDVTDAMLSSLDAIGVGGADMPEAFRRLYYDRFGLPVGTGYGLTEAPTAVTVEDVTQPMVPNSCGRALPQCRIVIVDAEDRPLAPDEVGEVCVAPADSGDFADCYRPMLGYWNRPEATEEALRGGMLHTSDIGMIDADGNLFIKDRKHDLIIRGGANVYPAEVERVLHDDSRVAACAVIGVPDDRLGERVVAFVELTDGATAEAEQLRTHCADQLARYKVPDTVEFVESFERTPMGKIRKTVLRERFGQA